MTGRTFAAKESVAPFSPTPRMSRMPPGLADRPTSASSAMPEHKSLAGRLMRA
jgi:hypothetical protein